jgi:hypothetical protein
MMWQLKVDLPLPHLDPTRQIDHHCGFQSDPATGRGNVMNKHPGLDLVERARALAPLTVVIIHLGS